MQTVYDRSMKIHVRMDTGHWNDMAAAGRDARTDMPTILRKAEHL